ncbi:MAG: dehydratase [Gemmataceae bacterium]|nr:dehydratase [Gemmataceae bacterium]
MSFTSMHLYYDDVEIGQEWESVGRTVTQTDIVNFAGLSGDFNPIHIDHEFCKTTPFREPIAHGLLVFSISTGLGLMAPPMRTLAFVSIKEWKFVEPVYIGDTIHVRVKIIEKEERSRGRRGLITWLRTVVNQKGKTVAEGLTVTLVEGRRGRGQEAGVGRQESGVGSQESGIRDRESGVGNQESGVGT